MLLFSLAAAAPIRATTEDGRTVMLAVDGTWAYDETPAPAVGEQIGDWHVDLEVSEVTGGTIGGATTPDLFPGGTGYMGVACRGKYAVPVFVFSDHPLREINVDEPPVPFGYEGQFVVVFRGRTRTLEGPAFIRGVREGFVLDGKRLWSILAEEPRELLAAANKIPGRPQWPMTVRFSLKGFPEAWAKVADACREHPAR